MMAALRDCMPMTSWLVLTMYFCFFCLTCRYVIEGPGGKIFSVISFIIGGTVIAMDTGAGTAGGIICLLGVLNMASHGPYFGRKVAPRYVTSFFSTDLEYDRRKLFFASILLAVPVVLFCRFLLNTESLWLMAVCAFLSVFCMRDILLHWVDPFCIHGKESKIVTLRDYQTRRMRGRHYRHVNMHFFWFKESGPYVADAWRQRLFVDHIGSKYQCVTGKGLFGTEYIVRVQMAEDRGIQSPEPMGYGKRAASYEADVFQLFHASFSAHGDTARHLAGDGTDRAVCGRGIISSRLSSALCGAAFSSGGNESLSGAVGAAQAVAESGSSGNRAGKNISPVGTDHAGIAGAYRRRKSAYL